MSFIEQKQEQVSEALDKLKQKPMKIYNMAKDIKDAKKKDQQDKQKLLNGVNSSCDYEDFEDEYNLSSASTGIEGSDASGSGSHSSTGRSVLASKLSKLQKAMTTVHESTAPSAHHVIHKSSTTVNKNSSFVSDSDQIEDGKKVSQVELKELGQGSDSKNALDDLSKTEIGDLKAAMNKTKLTLVYALCLIQFLTNSALSQLSPFYPLKAKERGLSVEQIGLVLGFFACLQIISSVLLGRYMHHLEGGRHLLIMIGSFLLIAQIAIMGLIDYIETAIIFLFFSFIAQALGGMGGGANLTASMAILSSFEGQEREMYIGWIEAANGVGLLFGPLTGALLYSMGGYKMPFFFFAGAFLIFYPFIVYSLLSYNKQKREIDAKMGKVHEKTDFRKEKVEIRALIKKPRFLFGLFSQMLLLMSIQYLAPNLALHLHNFGYSAIVIGCAYAIPAILYAATCPFIYLFTQRMRKRGVILTGFIIITLAMQMIGGNDSLFKFWKNPVFIFLGLCFIGMSAGLISIPVLPEMLECVQEDQELSQKFDMETIENTISGLFISFQSIGEAAGPIAASVFSQKYGFQMAQEIYSSFLLVFLVGYFLSCGNIKMFQKEPEKKSDQKPGQVDENDELVDQNKLGVSGSQNCESV